MDSSKGQKRLLEFQSSTSGHQDFSENATERDEAKRQRTALESTEDGFEEFVALLDRIQYMKANHMNLGICEEAFMREDLDVKVIKTKSPWIPSFVWEDFGVSAVKNTMCTERNTSDTSRKEPF